MSTLKPDPFEDAEVAAARERVAEEAPADGGTPDDDATADDGAGPDDEPPAA